MTIKENITILKKLEDLEKAIKSRLEKNLDVIELELMEELKNQLYWNIWRCKRYINYIQHPIHKKSVLKKIKFLEKIVPFDECFDDADEIPKLERIGEELAFYKKKYGKKYFDIRAFNDFFFEAFYRR